MNNTIKLTLFLLIFISVIALGIFGISKIEVDDFKKASVIFLLDASASNQKTLPAQKMSLRRLCSMLDPEDHVKIIRVSEDAYIIYEGSAQSGSEIRKVMDKFTQYDSKEYGTAYGDALKKAFNYSIVMSKQGYVPSVVVIGDLENEGATQKQINWTSLPSQIKNVKNQNPDFAMMFLYADPVKLDMIKEKLMPVLGENKLIIGNEVTTNKSLRRFLSAIGR